MSSAEMPWGRCDGRGTEDPTTGAGVLCGAKHVADGAEWIEELWSHACSQCGVYTPGHLAGDGGLCPRCRGEEKAYYCPGCGSYMGTERVRDACEWCYRALENQPPDDAAYCHGCGRVTHADDMWEGLCPECHGKKRAL